MAKKEPSEYDLRVDELKRKGVPAHIARRQAADENKSRKPGGSGK